MEQVHDLATFCTGMQPNARFAKAAADRRKALRTKRGHLIICDDGHPDAIGLPSSHGQSLTRPVSVESETLHRAFDDTADSAGAVRARQRA